MIYKQIQKDKLQPGANRSLLSLIMSEICIDGKKMDDTKAIQRLSQMVKVCVKNIELYDTEKTQDRLAEEKVYLKLIEGYLPSGVTEEDITAAISELGIDCNMKSMGALMKHLKTKFQIVDGNVVKKVLIGG